MSLYSLITKGADYDNKVVAVTGFFAYGEIPILFTSRDMFEASSVSDGIAVVLPASVKQVSSLYGLNHSYVELVGRFNARGSDTSDYHGFETAGTITDIKWVSKADHPWGYSEVPPPRLLQGDK
ncbi:hypothetical protein LQ772_08135 [Frateuria edaphi]|uniref:hypothetical protein n=1 Tax=Frateuria edaphi TaxID=2898793 RepID=UPI001E49DEEB|nr:hypothetical protein [Frateuria edaphi]UGB47238.1 hypothetical protein LQ772_08135 [Frateuria edaphi]